MVKKDRMLNEFIELVKIESTSYKEREMADALLLKLKAMGYDAFEDNAASKTGGNSGNIICKIKGNKDVSPILLMAHMDTVDPAGNKKPFIDGDIIKTDGTTILGGDDIAGVECILEAIRVLKEDTIEHGDIVVVFSIAEEIGLVGSKNLDYSSINAKYGFVVDHGGDIGGVAVKAPSQNKIDVIIKGRATHAGLEPEKGINAIQIVSYAISQMKLGRIDFETTCNIGIINGGVATNIVPDRVEIKAEATSAQRTKLDMVTSSMRKCFEDSVAKFGGSLEFKAELMYSSYDIKESEKIVDILKKASSLSGIALKLESTGGGSDTNILNQNGICSVNLSVGMDKVHSIEEQINITDIVKSANFLLAIIQCVET